MSKIATIPVFSSIVAILFFLNCQRWDFSTIYIKFPLKIIIFDYILTLMLFSFYLALSNNLSFPPLTQKRVCCKISTHSKIIKNN